MSKHTERKEVRDGRRRFENMQRRQGGHKGTSTGIQVESAPRAVLPVRSDSRDDAGSFVAGGSVLVYKTPPRPKKPEPVVARISGAAGRDGKTQQEIDASRLDRRRQEAAARSAQTKPAAGAKAAQSGGVSAVMVAAQTVSPIEPVVVNDLTGISDLAMFTGSRLWQQVVTLDRIGQIKIGDIIVVDPKRVIPDPRQLRKNFLEEKLAETTQSMKDDGQKEPVKIYRILDDVYHDWMILDGQRRWICSQRIDVPLIAQIVAKPANHVEGLGIMAILNTGEGHDHMEIVLAMQEFIVAGKSESWIASKFVKSIAWVKNYVACAQGLLPIVIEMLSSALPDNQRLRFPVARMLLKFPRNRQLDIARQVRGKRISEASRIINRELGEDEPVAGGRKQRPADRRGSVERKLDGAISGFRELQDMPDAALVEMLQHVPSETKDAFLASLTRAAELANDTASRVQTCLSGEQTKPLAQASAKPVRLAPPVHQAPASYPAPSTPPVPITVPSMQHLETTPPPISTEIGEPAPAPEQTPPTRLKVKGLIKEIDPGIDAMLKAMRVLGKAIDEQESLLRTMFSDMPPATKTAVANRAASLGVSLARLRLWLIRAGQVEEK